MRIVLLIGLFCSIAFGAARIDRAGSGDSRVYKNFAQNADFRYWQRQDAETITSRSDDAYSADRWYVLTSGSAVSGVRQGPGPQSRYIGRFTNADAGSQRFGVAQILAADRVFGLRSKQVTFGFYARSENSEISTIRACLGQWTGTADSVTSDVVSAWAATPTWISNFSCLNTPADITINSSSWTLASVTGTPSSSMNNLVLFAWTPTAEAAGDNLKIAQPQLVLGSSAITDWERLSIDPAVDLNECQRFYEKSYAVDTGVGTANTVGAFEYITQNSNSEQRSVQLKVTKKRTPTITTYSTNTGASGVFYRVGSGDETATAELVGDSTFSVFRSGGAIAGGLIRMHWAADAEL